MDIQILAQEMVLLRWLRLMFEIWSAVFRSRSRSNRPLKWLVFDERLGLSAPITPATAGPVFFPCLHNVRLPRANQKDRTVRSPPLRYGPPGAGRSPPVA